MKRVLVPLDKTEAAEAVLPIVKTLADAGIAVRVLHVAPVPESVVAMDGHLIAYSDQESSRMETEWMDYWASLEERQHVGAEPAIRFGDPATQILAEAEEFGADTIVVTTGRRCAVSRAVLGRVAERVLRRAGVGVLLYRPPADA
jgi:nucleotide-binding universal stress UspA family protein